MGGGPAHEDQAVDPDLRSRDIGADHRGHYSAGADSGAAPTVSATRNRSLVGTGVAQQDGTEDLRSGIERQDEMKRDRAVVRQESVQVFLARRRRRIFLNVAASVATSLFVLVACSATHNQSGQSNNPQQATAIDWTPVEQALGKSGAVQPGDVYKVSLPRSDLQVTVGGVQVKAPLALGSWVAFKKAGNMTMVMGDLVLTEDEVTPVLSKLQQCGVEQTALHNHVLHESPRVMYMHISAMGDAVRIAKAIHDALALSKTPFAAPRCC